MSENNAVGAFEVLRSHKWWFAGGGLVVLLLAVIVFTRLYPLPQQMVSDKEEQETAAVAVEVAHAARGDMKDTTLVTAQTSARVSLDLVFRVRGQVDEVYVSMGQTVEEGDPLVRLDESDIAPQVQQAEAAVEMARAQLDQVRAGARDEEIEQLKSAKEGAGAAFETAEWTYERMKRLHQQDVVSGAELKEAEMQYASALAQLESAEAQLEMALQGPQEEAVRLAEAQLKEAEAAMKGAQKALQDTLLESPIDGKVAYVRVDRGDLVDGGMPAVGVVAIDPIRVDALLTDRIVGLVDLGDSVTVKVAATGEGFTGEVSEIAPSPEPEWGMYPVRILIDNPDTELRPGMTAEVKITRERAEDVLIIPRQALSARADEYHVFVVEEGVARRRPVRVGMQDEDYAEVRSGLNEGDVVVYYGMQYLEDGTPVVVAGEKE